MKPPSRTANHSHGTELYAEGTWWIATSTPLSRLMRPVYRVFPTHTVASETLSVF